LKRGNATFGKDYFADLLERVREIRASERRFYQKVADIYAPLRRLRRTRTLTREFFATVQNKLHWAITGQTAAELIYTSAEATKLFMGLTTWKHAPSGKILKSDVTVAKNYLHAAHIKSARAPTTANVLLRTHGKNQLLVAATDLNVSLTAELKSTNASDGGLTLGAKNLPPRSVTVRCPLASRSCGFDARPRVCTRTTARSSARGRPPASVV
jgi:Virulence protein RhuM family